MPGIGGSAWFGVCPEWEWGAGVVLRRVEVGEAAGLCAPSALLRLQGPGPAVPRSRGRRSPAAWGAASCRGCARRCFIAPSAPTVLPITQRREKKKHQTART